MGVNVNIYATDTDTKIVEKKSFKSQQPAHQIGSLGLIVGKKLGSDFHINYIDFFSTHRW